MQATGMVSDVLRELIRKSGKMVKSIAAESGVNVNSIYTIVNRNTDRVSLKTLDALAKYFGYDITVFLGLDAYEPRIKLREDEKALLRDYRSLRPDVAREVAELVRRPPEPLTASEKEILDICRGFSPAGQERVLETCQDMKAAGRYKK